MGPLSSQLVNSYRLPIVTISLSLTIFAVLQLATDRQMDGQKDGIGLGKGRTMHESALAACKTAEKTCENSRGDKVKE